MQTYVRWEQPVKFVYRIAVNKNILMHVEPEDRPAVREVPEFNHGTNGENSSENVVNVSTTGANQEVKCTFNAIKKYGGMCIF